MRNLILFCLVFHCTAKEFMWNRHESNFNKNQQQKSDPPLRQMWSQKFEDKIKKQFTADSGKESNDDDKPLTDENCNNQYIHNQPTIIYENNHNYYYSISNNNPIYGNSFDDNNFDSENTFSHFQGDIYTTISCQNESMIISCPNNKQLLIYNVLYGRTNNQICGNVDVPMEGCKSTNSTDVVRHTCDGMQYCQLSATNSFLGGDPCPNVMKYLQIKYLCLPPSTSSGKPKPAQEPPQNPNRLSVKGDVFVQTECQNSSMNINCFDQGEILILSAFYGRDRPDICGGEGKNVGCSSSEAYGRTSMICNRKSSCQILVVDYLFDDDTCPAGVSKYLRVEYTCKKHDK